MKTSNKTKIKNAIYSKLFDLYLFMSNFGEYESEKHNVYDHLGIIDTLGWQNSKTKYTSGYSNELVSVSAFRIPPFRFWINLIHSEEKEIKITKTPYIK